MPGSQIFPGHPEIKATSRHHWSFAFTHASTTSKCILFGLQCLYQLSSFVEFQWWDDRLDVNWIVSEMLDWLKVCDTIVLKLVLRNPDNLKEPKGQYSSTG